MSERDQRRFGNIVFSRGTIRERDEQRLRELYNVMNFGGVAHEAHERAVSAEELEPAERPRPF